MGICIKWYYQIYNQTYAQLYKSNTATAELVHFILVLTCSAAFIFSQDQTSEKEKKAVSLNGVE